MRCLAHILASLPTGQIIFALKHQKEYPYLRNWGRNRNREFGYLAYGSDDET